MILIVTVLVGCLGKDCCYLMKRLMGGDVKIYVDEMPELPIEIPIPKSSRVVGGLSWNDTYVLVMDVKEENVIEFYRRSLIKDGWVEKTCSSNFALFCWNGYGLSVYVDTSVKIVLKNNSPLCETPTLKKPPESQLLYGSSGRSGSIETLDIVVKTNLSSRDLIDFYRRELEEEGWKFLEGSSYSIRGINDSDVCVLTVQEIDKDVKVVHMIIKSFQTYPQASPEPSGV